jgi:hypothetical protein
MCRKISACSSRLLNLTHRRINNHGVAQLFIPAPDVLAELASLVTPDSLIHSSGNGSRYGSFSTPGEPNRSIRQADEQAHLNL